MRRYSMPSVGVYDLVTHLLFRGRYDEIAAAIAAEAPDGASIVDLGSGTGEVLVRLAKLAPSLDLTGVDVDPEMVVRAQAKAVGAIPAGGRRPAFLVADAGALPFPDASVDLLVSSYAVHHLPDRHAARAEILRVLKPGGRAIIWDVMSPHGDPGQEAPAGAPAGHHMRLRPHPRSTAPERSTPLECPSSSAGSRPNATSFEARRGGRGILSALSAISSINRRTQLRLHISVGRVTGLPSSGAPSSAGWSGGVPRSILAGAASA